MKTKKKIAKVVVASSLVLGLSIQASASFGVWRTFSLPAGGGTNNGSAVTRDINGTALSRTTANNLASHQSVRVARVESQGQSMWSNPQVRVVRGTTQSTWRAVANNSGVSIDISSPTGRTYTVNARSAVNQVGTDVASFRLNVERAR